MATLNIGGTRVKVDDAFLTMSPEQQNAAVEEIARSLPAQAARQAGQVSEPASVLGKIGQAADDIVRIGANAATFGYADKLAGALSGDGTQAEREKTGEARNRAGNAAIATDILGTFAPMSIAAKAGLTTARLLPQAASVGERLLLGTGLAGAEGAGYGALHAAGNDESIKSGLATGAIGGIGGNLLGEAVSAAAPAVKGALGIENKSRAKQAIVNTLTRSGRTSQQITADMSQAAAEGQGGYTLADALGNSGQRMLAGVARSPGDMRQVIADTLEGRQAGQGRRVASFLDDAFKGEGTAAQNQALIKDVARVTNQNPYAVAYEAGDKAIWSPELERLSASPSVQTAMGGAVNVWADNAIADGYGAMKPGALVEGGGILKMLRGKVPVFPNLQFWDYTKRILDNEIGAAVRSGADSKVRTLTALKNSIVKELDKAAPEYAAARSTAKGFFDLHDAVEAGKKAATRGRTEDTTQLFNSLNPEQRQAFRSGYVDPLIGQAQGAAHGVNKARPLINDATAVEFPAFAGQGGERLQRQLARENAMFETRNAALGGSRTADNLADMNDVDPSLIAELIRHPIANGARHLIGAAANVATGRNQAVRDMIAQTLLHSAGKEGSRGLSTAIAEGQTAKRLAEAKRQAIIRALMGGTVALAP